MRIVLIRHGKKEAVQPDCLALLTETAKKDAEQLGKRLQELDVKPDVYLTSRWQHALDTAEVLSTSDEPSKPVIPVTGLTPNTDEASFDLSAIIEEVHSASLQTTRESTIALVGHEPRLSQLATSLTGQRIRPLERLEIVLIHAKTLKKLLAGKGKIEARIPVRAFQEKELRGKIQSKVSVATFLAGFTFVPLTGMIDGFRTGEINPGIQFISHTFATLFLFGALVLFISAVYIYDRLSMPEGFWTLEARPRSFSKQHPASFRRDLAKCGPLYAYMIRTWNWVVTPGVWLMIAGFFAMSVGVFRWQVDIGLLLIAVIAWLYYNQIKPRLGVD